jgi:conjugative transfer signal peptidase TraF
MKTQQTTMYRRVLYITKMCVICIAILVLCGALLPYRWNGSASVPIGLYRVRHRRPEAGELIAFCLPKEVALYAKERGYIGFGFSCPGWTQPLLKPVVAVAGDAVSIAPAGVTVRGYALSHTQIFETDSQGRAHVVWIMPGDYRVPSDMVFVLSAFHERSWDSRYFGFVSTTAILSTMEPAWTW